MKVKFNVGDRFVASVKAVHAEGVNIVMPNNKGSGVISPKCWGDGMRRREALAAIRPGDTFPVVVRKYYPQTMTLSLDLDDGSMKPMTRGFQRKPDYELVAPGTTFLVDCANLLGKVGHEDAARKLYTVRDALTACGHTVALFLEHRAYTWFMHHQDSEVKAEAFKRFVAETNVSLVQGEADLAMLQCARQIPGSVCVSDDGFDDYRNVFGDIVGTSRVRSFSWVTIKNDLFLSIEGLADAIVIKQDDTAGASMEPPNASMGGAEGPLPNIPEIADMSESPALTDATCPQAPTTVDVATCPWSEAPSSHEDLLSLGTTMLAKGAEKKAIACFAKAAKKNPYVWAELAWMYHDGNGVKADKSKARRFFRKAREMVAKKRQCKIRRARARLRKNRLFGLVTLRGCAA